MGRYVCAACGRVIADEELVDAVFAVEQLMGDGVDGREGLPIDGLAAWFHWRHFPGAPGWRRASPPASRAAA